MATPADLAKERRKFNRFSSTGKVPAIIARKDGKQVNFFCIDVSKQGLGLITSVPLTKGEHVRLDFQLEGEFFDLWVVWSTTEGDPLSNDAVHRCGLHTDDTAANLVDFFKNYPNIILEDNG